MNSHDYFILFLIYNLKTESYFYLKPFQLCHFWGPLHWAPSLLPSVMEHQWERKCKRQNTGAAAIWDDQLFKGKNGLGALSIWVKDNEQGAVGVSSSGEYDGLVKKNKAFL